MRTRRAGIVRVARTVASGPIARKIPSTPKRAIREAVAAVPRTLVVSPCSAAKEGLSSMVSVAAAASLDVVDLKCPLPVLKARKALNALAPGAVLEVLASDPGAPEDFAAFCGATGHRLIAQSTEGAILRFLIQKQAPSDA